MTINDILKLEIKKNNLRKIESFINQKDKDSTDYYKAVSYKALMSYKLDLVKEAITLLLTNLNDSKNDDAIISYCSSLIEIYLDLSDFEKALKYIELKEKHLKPIDMQKHTKDMILYYAKRRDIKNATRYINSYLEDDILEEDKIFVQRLLLDYAYEDNDINSFITNYNKIIKYYLQNDLKDEYQKLYLYKLNILYNNNLSDDCLNFIKSINIDLLDLDYKIEFYTTIIKIHIDKGLFRKAGILDSEYEQIISKSENIELKRKYYNVSLELYKKLNNNFSIEYILNKLRELEPKKVEEKKVKSHYKDLSNVIIERVIEAPKVNVDIKELAYKNADISNVLVSDKFNKFTKIFNILTKSDEFVSFRENLRLILIEFNKNFKFDESILLIKGESIYGYHYKLNRLYDKDFNNIDISKSILNRTIELNKEVVIKDLINSYYNYDIILKDTTKFVSSIVFPIYYNNLIIGSLGFFFNNEYIDEGLFEYYKYFSSLVNVLFNYNHFVENYKNSNDTLKILENKIPTGIKTIYLDKVILNDKCMEIFDISTHELTNSEYISLLNYEGQVKYQNALESLLYKDIKEIEIDYYLINNKCIKEHFIKGIDNIIYSYIIDESKYKEKENKLLEYAYSDNFTKVLSYKAFKTDSQELLNNHNKSIVLIDSNEFKLYEDLYGYEFKNQIIYSIGNFLIENQKDDYLIYHLDSTRYILLYNNNDKRVLKKNINILLENLNKYLNKINKRVNIKFYAGIFRQSAKDRTYTLNEMLSNATEALLDSYNREEVVVYDNQIYNHSFFIDYENELAISEAIDNNRLSSVYRPIYDIDNKNVLGYIYSFSLDNMLIDESTFNNLVKKRRLEYKMDKYKISHVLEDLKTFYNKTGYYLNVFIPIYSVSLTNPTFISFLNKSFNFYKINSSFISFKICGEIEDNNTLDLLKNSEINLGVSNLDDLFKYKLDSLYLNYNEYSYEDLCLFKSILRKKRLILTDVSENENIKDATLITRYITGKGISKMVSIDNLINQALKKEKK